MAKSNKTWDSGRLESSMKALLVTLNGSLLPIPPIETIKWGPRMMSTEIYATSFRIKCYVLLLD